MQSRFMHINSYTESARIVRTFLADVVYFVGSDFVCLTTRNSVSRSPMTRARIRFSRRQLLKSGFRTREKFVHPSRGRGYGARKAVEIYVIIVHSSSLERKYENRRKNYSGSESFPGTRKLSLSVRAQEVVRTNICIVFLVFCFFYFKQFLRFSDARYILFIFFV